MQAECQQLKKSDSTRIFVTLIKVLFSSDYKLFRYILLCKTAFFGEKQVKNSAFYCFSE